MKGKIHFNCDRCVHNDICKFKNDIDHFKQPVYNINKTEGPVKIDIRCEKFKSNN